MRLKRRYLAGIALVVVIVSIISLFLYQNQSSTPPTSQVQLVSYEWDVKVINWEHEYVEANVTLLNSGDADAEFTIDISPYDGEKYFGFSKRWSIALPSGSEETFTFKLIYELLVSHHHANAIEIIAGILAEDKTFKEIYFQEFSSKA